jgi:predicted anti-sigma-YlaC factor YlaD
MTSTTSLELVCREAVEMVTDYLGDVLAPEDRVRLEDHLRNCPPCTTYLEQIRTTLALAAALGHAAPPADVGDEEKLLALFRNRRGTTR